MTAFRPILFFKLELMQHLYLSGSNPAKPLQLIRHYLQFLTFQRILMSPKFLLLPEKRHIITSQKKDVFSKHRCENLNFFSLCMTDCLFYIFTKREER